ncbi:MAG: ABC transporter substrate-binding protein [Chloroflexi bacterium]|nr:MAG: ABC transporter substrate-binding protein [Chloroflexota bacterium]TME95932.1 MAG: ABC transporter substrate-binding protein [Chloroflexota bacterium]
MAGDSFTRREVTRRSVLVGGAGAIGGLVVGGLAGSALAPKSAGTGAGSRGSIKVVGIFPIGGVIASDGKEMQNGVQMAVDEINARGGLIGYHLDYVVIDDKDSSTDQITTAFNRAVSVEKADVIFSGYHLASGPEFDIVANAGTLYYNVNTQIAWVNRYKGNPSKYWGIFQCDPTESWYGQGFAYWVDGALNAGLLNSKVKTYSIISGKSAYGTVIATGFQTQIKQLGWTELSNDGVSEGSVPAWGPVLSRVKQAKPTVLFTSDFSPADDAAMAKEWAASPTKTLVYQQYGPSVPEYLTLAGPAANGIVWATVLGLLPDKIGNDFRARYKAKFGAEPGWANAGGCYDEVNVWAAGVAMSGDPKNYKAVAKATESVIWRGTTGSISFVDHTGVQFPAQTADASVGQPHIIVQIQDGVQKVVSPTPFTSGTFVLPSWMR